MVEIKEGDFVIASCEDEVHAGIVQYVMTDGMFGIQYSDYSLKASLEEPVVLVRILEFEEDYGWDETEYLVGVKASMVEKIEPLFIPDLQNNDMSQSKTASLANNSSISKAKKPDYANMLNRPGSSKPLNMSLYNKIKEEAKAKFDVYPSAVANSWVVAEYKRRGGTYKSNKSFWDGSFDPRNF